MKPLLIILLILLLGPLRRPFFRHARFTVPAIFGALLGFIISTYWAARSGAPAPISTVVILIATFGFAIGIGESAKLWFDQTFGPRERKP